MCQIRDNNIWPSTNRRKFLAQLSASSFVAAAHGSMLWSSPLPDELPEPVIDAEARIRHLRLQTAAPLATMRAFYGGVLGMPTLAQQVNAITFGAGSSKITFESVEASPGGEPFYHVAFNIPENKHELSKQWLVQQKINIHSVNHFRHWNAHAVFYLDPANNLLEFIARHDLDNAASGSFAPHKDILCASEIAFIVEDVVDFAAHLKKALALPDYRPGNRVFAAAGDEHGLLLVFQRGRKWHQPAATYPAVVNIAGDRPAKFQSKNYPYQIRMQAR